MISSTGCFNLMDDCWLRLALYRGACGRKLAQWRARKGMWARLKSSDWWAKLGR